MEINKVKLLRATKNLKMVKTYHAINKTNKIYQTISSKKKN